MTYFNPEDAFPTREETPPPQPPCEVICALIEAFICDKCEEERQTKGEGVA